MELGKWLKNRLREKSTWIGILTAAGSIGLITLNPDTAQEVGAAFATVVGFVIMVIKERGEDTAE